ncbi:MAG: 16S rRNA (adenine(1518)-N(6)/adenine(1519)-N(6))-dimethyltransferase RsmA [Verrucomicrobiota bacterium]|nr:16S rRNA (adenine(1518)-N(6)/adenine(1519)-N(6))-dimethyltransferase RsmA [Verrucomicrobiota bacterium]
MRTMTLTEMRRVLAERGIKLTRSLGQTFLFDGNQLRRIIALAGLTAGDQVLEIGPGLGPLTELMLAMAGKVIAIEKDHRLVECLRERFGDRAKLELIEADALDYLRDCGCDWRGFKLVANLPYSVASPILVELAQQTLGPSRMVVTVQLEVARRLMAQPGSAEYGTLTLLVQASYEPKGWFRIPSTCFYPEPKVDSACIQLDRRESELVHSAAADCFGSLIRMAFEQRRKMMFKVLKAKWNAAQLQQAFAAVGLDPKVRPEEVSLSQFAEMARILAQQTK